MCRRDESRLFIYFGVPHHTSKMLENVVLLLCLLEVASSRRPCLDPKQVEVVLVPCGFTPKPHPTRSVKNVTIVLYRL